MVTYDYRVFERAKILKEKQNGHKSGSYVLKFTVSYCLFTIYQFVLPFFLSLFVYQYFIIFLVHTSLLLNFHYRLDQKKTVLGKLMVQLMKLMILLLPLALQVHLIYRYINILVY